MLHRKSEVPSITSFGAMANAIGGSRIETKEEIIPSWEQKRNVPAVEVRDSVPEMRLALALLVLGVPGDRAGHAAGFFIQDRRNIPSLIHDNQDRTCARIETQSSAERVCVKWERPGWFLNLTR